MTQRKIIIIGAGPCGLGAAWRLQALGHTHWNLFEKNPYPGGLSASFKDESSFYWDIGGHVLFSHYDAFDQVLDQVMDPENDWLHHDRSAWVWMENRFIPYPIQNNIHRLSTRTFQECLHGLLDLYGNAPSKNATTDLSLRHFGDWIDAGFGTGLAKHFLRPYNYKVWAFPVETLSHDWVGERVATVDIKRIIDNHLFDRDDIGWGPNSRFRFPQKGGTGTIWQRISDALPEKQLHFNACPEKIDLQEKRILFQDGTEAHYDAMISTIPLTDLARMIDTTHLTGSNNEHDLSDRLASLASPSSLKYASTHVVGIALTGETPAHLADKCWLYFPENNAPFYRVTIFSNYSPNNVPDRKNSWSLMCEVSESSAKPVDHEKIVEQVIQGAVNTRLIENKSQVHHTWYRREEKGYPTPSVHRNQILFPVLNLLEDFGIHSRGRFGAWRYEVGNMDHSFMQGMECASHLIHQEREMTLWYPNIVNSPHPSTQI